MTDYHHHHNYQLLQHHHKFKAKTPTSSSKSKKYWGGGTNEFERSLIGTRYATSISGLVYSQGLPTRLKRKEHVFEAVQRRQTTRQYFKFALLTTYITLFGFFLWYMYLQIPNEI